MTENPTKICRLCFKASSSVFYQLHIQKESIFRKQLDVIFPEINLDIVTLPLICVECSEVLQKAYDCKTTWIACEKRLQSYIQKNEVENVSLLDVLNEENLQEIKPLLHNEFEIKEEKEFEDVDVNKPKKAKEKCFVCETCPKTFKSVNGLRYHAQRCKGVEKDPEETNDIVEENVDEQEPKESKQKTVNDRFESNNQPEIAQERINEFEDNLDNDDCTHNEDSDDEFKNEPGLCQKCNKENCSCEFPCDICKKKFMSDFKLQRHKWTHSDRPRPYSCNLCNKTFLVKSALINHQATHMDAKEFLCDNCSAGFVSKKYLQDHIRRVHLKKDEERLSGEFPCDVCLKVFNTLAKMKRHRVRHNERERTHTCEICKTSFFTKSNLSNHMATHAEGKEFLCERCSLCFASKKYLREHMRRLHNVFTRKPFKTFIQKENSISSSENEFTCDICNKKFSQKRYVMQHISTIHFGIKRKRIIKNLRCEMCGQIFTSNSLLTLHIRTHTGERPYKCDQCEKSFAQASSLNTHKQAIHSNEKPYTCEYCGKKFATKGMLLKHIQAVHIADKIPKNHKCAFCGKAFRTRSQMLFHIRWHTNDRRYSCDICNKSFVNNACLRKHRAIHFDEKAYICEICGKGFHQKFNLKIHMKVHSKVE